MTFDLEVRKAKFCWKQKQRMAVFVTAAILGLVRPNASADRCCTSRGQFQELGMSELFSFQVLNQLPLWKRSASVSVTVNLRHNHHRILDQYLQCDLSVK